MVVVIVFMVSLQLTVILITRQSQNGYSKYIHVIIELVLVSMKQSIFENIGEMFLNFMLDQEVQQYVGVDLTPLVDKDLKSETCNKVVWEKYLRCAMGLAMSPNHTTRAILVTEEFLTGIPW